MSLAADTAGVSGTGDQSQTSQNRQSQNRQSQSPEGTRSEGQQSQQQGRGQGQQQAYLNVGESERIVSVAAGAILAGLGLSRASLPGLLIAGVGGALIYRGATGHCHAYQALNMNTATEEETDLAARGVRVAQAMLIGKPADELYRFWRNFENLPQFMTHLKEVKVTGDRISHWVAQAPKPYGDVEWDAEITADEPGKRIAWRSLPGSQVEIQGEITFEKALGDRGTNVVVRLSYLPPAGKLGHWIATLTGNGPDHQISDDLRNFKKLMEVGEIITTVGQPRGSCNGQGGRRQTEDD